MTAAALQGELRDYLSFAIDLARAAGRVTLEYFRRGVVVEEKPDHTPVTVADRETEVFLREQIRRRYPWHGILGEEFGEQSGNSPWRWVLDPIDGTRAFVHGVPLYTVLIALEHEGRSVLGIIHNPSLDETAAAADGLGCTINGEEARVSGVADLATARIQVTDFAELAQRHPHFTSRLLRESASCRSWSDAFGYLLVATGRAEVMIDAVMNYWDIAPLGPIIREAGGCLTALDGGAPRPGAGTLATNGPLHPVVLDLVEHPAGRP